MPKRRFYLYVITCAINGKRYVGWTSKTTDHRLTRHKVDSRNPSKKCKLYRAMRKYGEDAFTIKTLVISDDEDYVKDLEVKLIKRWQTETHGYNSTVGGDGISGYRYTDEQRRQRSERQKARRGKIPYKPRPGASGDKCSMKRPEVRAKVSAALRGRVPWNKNLRGVQKSNRLGKTFEEILGPEKALLVRTRMSINRRGKPAWNKGLKGIYHPSPEVMEKTHSKTRGRSNPAKAIEMKARWADPAFREMMIRARRA